MVRWCTLNSKNNTIMAQDAKGRKFNRIPGYVRIVNGKVIKVKPHIRSNRSDSNGKAKSTK